MRTYKQLMINQPSRNCALFLNFFFFLFLDQSQLYGFREARQTCKDFFLIQKLTAEFYLKGTFSYSLFGKTC